MSVIVDAESALRPCAPAAMPLNRLVRAYVLEAKYECIRVARVPPLAIGLFILPIVLYLFFGVVMASPQAEAATTLSLFLSFCVFAVGGPGMFAFGAGVAIERAQGGLALKRALPMPPGSYLLAKLAMAVCFAIIVLIPLMAISMLGRAPLSAPQYAAILAIGALGTAPFCAIGLFIGTHIAGQAAAGITNLVFLAMLYLSGLFFAMPAGIAWIAYATPTFHLKQLALAVAGTPPADGVSVHVAVLVFGTAAIATLAIRRFARNG